MTEQTIEEGKTLALVSYAWLIGVVIAFYMNNDKKNEFTYFHIRQSLGLWLTFWAVGLIISNYDMTLLRLSFWMFFGVLFIYSFITASTGKAYPIPLVGKFYQKLFAGLGKK